MIITFNWLREHLETNLNSLEIINTLEDLGLNLKTAYLNNGLWDLLEIVKITEKKKHPNADKLNLYSIIKQNGEKLEIVCGDQELEPNNYVIYAKPGTKMPSGITLKTAKIRDIESPGMLCSAAEINLPIPSNKVLRCFKEDFGKTVAKAYDEEGIFEIELTPNRGEAFSIRGIARLLYTEGYGELKEYKIFKINAPKKDLVQIKSNKCKGIYCALFKYEIQETSNEIKKRLQLTNHNILNLDLVDYTNYLAHELGQPMHVFDYEKINKTEITVETLDAPADFQTLSNEKIQLAKGTLVFKSNNQVIQWPSIIGGENSKVDKNSKYILLEMGIYATDALQRRKYKITTSAAKRAEYGLNPFALEEVASRFLNLININPEYIQNINFNEKKEINFNFDQIEKILGIQVSKDEFKTKMIKKGFVFNENGTITPSPYKFLDITTQNCIVEEFAISLYKNLNSLNLSPAYPKHQKNPNDLSKLAINEGFFECKNISLTNKEDSAFGLTDEGRVVKNFSNLNYSILRGTLIPDLLSNFSWHLKNKYKYSNFFESGLIYGSNYKDKQVKIFTAISNNQSKLRTLLTKILQTKNIIKKITMNSSSNIQYAENNTCFYYKDQLIAILSTLNESILSKYDIKECYSLEIMQESFENIKYLNNFEFIKNTSPIYKDITFILKNKKSDLIFNTLNLNNINYNIKSVYKASEEITKLTIEFILYEKNNLSTEQINQKIENIKQLIACPTD